MKQNLQSIGICFSHYRAKILFGFAALLFAATVYAQSPRTTANYRVVPLPQEIKTTQGEAFLLNAKTRIAYPTGDAALLRNAQMLAEYLEKSTGIKPALSTAMNGENVIVLTASLSNANPEAYRLNVTKDRIRIDGASTAGTFYGVQTLRKSIPQIGAQQLAFPAAEIADQPRFSYRGAMLDVARHFFSTDEVKTFIDMLALHNINRFHWHLTDDQGWRIEIKKYPRLTQVSAFRSETVVGRNSGEYDGKPHGGFYTQQQAREIVKYAADRHITVIPEIDMPGHMVAALAAYPELGCTGGPYEVRKTWGVAEEVLCAGNDKTLQFAKDVLEEVMDIFPGPYVNIGGDECPKNSWEKCPKCQARIKEQNLEAKDGHTAEERLQSYFMREMTKCIAARGRRVLGWDEMLEGGLAPGATVLSWRGMEGGVQAAKMGHDAVMCPVSHLYLDYYQTKDRELEPLAFNGFVPVEKTYDFNPVSPELTPEQAKHIIGVQANLWTEYMDNFPHVQYMALPRLAAASEVQWTQPEKKNFDDFANRMPQLFNLYKALGYRYGTHLFNVNINVTPSDKPHTVNVTLTARPGAEIYYTVDTGNAHVKPQTLYTQPIEVSQSGTLRAFAKYPGGILSQTSYEDILISKSTMCPVKFNLPPHPKYRGDSDNELTDARTGNQIFNSGRWVGCVDNDFDVTIDLGKTTDVSSVSVRTLVSTGSWILPPRYYEVWTSLDGRIVKRVVHLQVTEMSRDSQDKVKTETLSFATTQARYLRVVVRPERSMPSWHSGAGNPAFVFVDEISVE